MQTYLEALHSSVEMSDNPEWFEDIALHIDMSEN